MTPGPSTQNLVPSVERASGPRRWGVRLLWALLVLAVVGGAWRAHDARQTQRSRAEAAATALRQPVVYELMPGDVETAQQRTLRQTLALAGTVKALQTAVVKARVAGELQGLTVREGDAVRAGQVLARIDPTEPNARLEQARQQAEAAQAQVAIAERAWRNNQALVQQGFISATALDSSRANLAAAQANLEAARAAQAVAQKTQADTVLRSPLAGQVAARLAQNGERLAVDARVLELVDPTALEWEVTVPAADAARVRVGQTAVLEGLGADPAVTARVVRVSPTVQPLSRSVAVYLALPVGAGLRHGQFLQGLLTVGEQTGVSVAPESIRNDKPQPYVQVLRPSDDNTARVAHVPVRVLSEGWDTPGRRYVITDSIANNALLLSGKAGFVQENTVVRVLPAAAKP